jgi:hypothetical protein
MAQNDDNKALDLLERIAMAVEALAAGVGHIPKGSKPANDPAKEEIPASE